MSLRSWRERIGAPLKESQNDSPDKEVVRKIESSAKYPFPSSDFADAPVRKTSAKSDSRPQNTPPVVKDAAYYEARCWFNACDELRDAASDKWCTAHLAGRAAEVERAVEWLSDLGYVA